MLWKTGFAGISVIFFSDTFFSSSELYAVPKSQPDGAAFPQHNPFEPDEKSSDPTPRHPRVVRAARRFFLPADWRPTGFGCIFPGRTLIPEEEAHPDRRPDCQADGGSDLSGGRCTGRSVPYAPLTKGSAPASGRARAASLPFSTLTEYRVLSSE